LFQVERDLRSGQVDGGGRTRGEREEEMIGDRTAWGP
jgi:hypothetical protein